ncbi:LysR substrate-binding domain-containing protein [Alistipes sp.]|uniref:LysR substrate-binding domain-containing protein n=1 Tax=Alistipes sp. TaxID=1872444 RepID=UPI003AEFFEFA
MDDFRLKVFIAAARTLSFTRAAERLFISQPAVSKHVGELESRFKVRLFDRLGSRLELTDAGRVLLASAERIDDDYRRLEYEMSRCGSRIEGELRLGASTTVAQYLLPRILARFTTRFPGVRVSLLTGNSGQVEQALAEHAIDLGAVESLSRRPCLHYAPFAPDELVLVARTGGRYAGVESVTPDELRSIPLVLRESGSGTLEVIDRALAGAGIRLTMLDVKMRLGSTEGIKSFVRHSDAMAIVSVVSVVDELRSGVLRIVDLEGLALRRDFSFVTAEARPEALAGQFMEFARANAR